MSKLYQEFLMYQSIITSHKYWKELENKQEMKHSRFMNETIVLTNKNTKVVCFKYYNHKTMTCNIKQRLKVLCALKTMKGENERLFKKPFHYILSHNPKVAAT